jgi:hypothetical protein
MRSRRTARFKSLFEELPAEIQQSAERAGSVLTLNTTAWFHN